MVALDKTVGSYEVITQNLEMHMNVCTSFMAIHCVMREEFASEPTLCINNTFNYHIITKCCYF